MSIIDELAEQAQELIDLGNSKEQARGQGMKEVSEELRKYYYGFMEYRKYFDQLPLKSQEELAKKLLKLKIED